MVAMLVLGSGCNRSGNTVTPNISTPEVVNTAGVVVGKFEDPLPTDPGQREVFLYRWLANQPEGQRFESQTTKDWEAKYEAFSGALLQLAAQASYDTASLSNVLELIKADTAAKRRACIPVGAYVASMSGEAVWVVVGKWEGARGYRLCHVCVYAWNQRALTNVAYARCN
jgi:hypothetical protein